jgi:hypothetical protein
VSDSIVRRAIRAFGVDDAVKVASGAAFLWVVRPDLRADDVGFMHRSFGWLAWRPASFRKRLILIGGIVAWPLVVPLLAAYFTARNGREIRERTGKPLLRQAAEQVRLAARHAVLPPWYYIYDFHDDDKRRRAGDYLNRFEVKRCIYPFVRAHYAKVLGMAEGGSRMFVSDKLMFARLCAEHGVRAAPVLHAAERGSVSAADARPSTSLPPQDLFIKPMRGCGGRGAVRWEYQGDGTYRANHGAVLTEQELIAAIADASRRQSLIVQPRLVNHPELRRLTPNGLCTVRALTCRNERGGFELTHAVFRMPVRADAAVDNFHAGGLAAPIALADGRLGRATSLGLSPGAGWHDTHPTTGGRILDYRLPFWDAVVALVTRAHELFPDLVALGWDVAILEGGPCLVEVNKGPDVDLIQRPHAAPLGPSRFGELLAFHLEQALKARYSDMRSMPLRARVDAVPEPGLPKRV